MPCLLAVDRWPRIAYRRRVVCHQDPGAAWDCGGSWQFNWADDWMGYRGPLAG